MERFGFTIRIAQGRCWGVLIGWVLGGLGTAFAFAQQAPPTPTEAQTPPRTLEDLLQADEGKPTPAQRQPVPDPADVQKTTKILQEVYKDDIAAAKTPEKKRALAGRFLADALEAQVPAEQFALLQAARQWAVQAGDVSFAIRCADALAERFQVDLLSIKAEVLEALSKTGTGVSPVELAEATEPLVLQAAEQERYDVAVRLSRLALQAARRTKNADLIKRLTAQNKQVEQAAKAFQKIQAALETLRQNPQDAEAHLLVGRYLCFEKGRWDEGLRHLAQCSDESLRRLANDDLAQPTESAKQITLAEAWWQRSQQEKDSPAQAAMQGRSAYWYQKALPNLTGLDKIKAERRIQEAADSGGKPTPAQSPPRHYLDPQNRKNVNIFWWSGEWKGDGSKFLQIESIATGGYRLTSQPNSGWLVFIFPRVPVNAYKMRMTFTVEKERCDVNVCNVAIQTQFPRIILPPGEKHTLEVWLENQELKALLDSRPVPFEPHDPQHYLHYHLSLKAGASIVIHDLQFIPIKPR